MTVYRQLNTVAYDHLRDMIYNSEFEFNKIYSETKLATLLNISRTPMRDALNRLAQERYIDILPSKGFILHSPTYAEVTEAYHIRLMIEGYCSRIVARDHQSPKANDTIAKMEEALVNQRKVLRDDASYSLSQFWRDDLVFHEALLEYVNINSIIVQYESYMHLFMPHHLIENEDAHRMHPVTLMRHRATLVEHENIIDALKSGSEDKADQAVLAHVDSSLKASLTAKSK